MTEKTIVCLKWGEVRYNNEWVNRLYRGVAANLRPPFNFVCFTDNPNGLVPQVEIRDISTLSLDQEQQGLWLKLSLMHPVANLRGRCMFIDLDSAITGPLDDFFDLPDSFYMVQNWIERRKQILRPRPQSGNSSVFLFHAGREAHAAEKFIADPQHAFNRKLYVNPQAFLTRAVGLDRITWLPDEKVRSFKRHAHPIYPLNLILAPKIPARCRILTFHGRPNTDEVIAGYGKWGGRKYSRPMPELAQYWR